MSADVCTGPLEGWKAIADFLGIQGDPEVTRKRLREWELHDGLPVVRVRNHVFADPAKLRAWWAAHAGTSDTSRRTA